jgi:hypothetical protein
MFGVVLLAETLQLEGSLEGCRRILSRNTRGGRFQFARQEGWLSDQALWMH